MRAMHAARWEDKVADTDDDNVDDCVDDVDVHDVVNVDGCDEVDDGVAP